MTERSPRALFHYLSTEPRPGRSSGSQVRDPPPPALGQPLQVVSSAASIPRYTQAQVSMESHPSQATPRWHAGLPETAFLLLRSPPSPLHYPLAEVADIRRGERVQIPLPVFRRGNLGGAPPQRARHTGFRVGFSSAWGYKAQLAKRLPP